MTITVVACEQALSSGGGRGDHPPHPTPRACSTGYGSGDEGNEEDNDGDNGPFAVNGHMTESALLESKLRTGTYKT